MNCDTDANSRIGWDFAEPPLHLPPDDKRWPALMALRATMNDNALYSRWTPDVVLRACFDVINGISKNVDQFMFCDSPINDELIADAYDRVHAIGRTQGENYTHAECYARTLATVSIALENDYRHEWQAFDREVFVNTEWPIYER